MAHARIPASLPPNIDPTKAPIAFGERALPKLNEQIQSADLLIRQRALMALCDLVHDPENAYQAINLGFLENLKALLLDANRTVRQKTTEVFFLLSTHNVGREGFIRSDVIIPLSRMLDDPVILCRVNMHKAFEMLSELPYGAVPQETTQGLVGPLFQPAGCVCIIPTQQRVEQGVPLLIVVKRSA